MSDPSSARRRLFVAVWPPDEVLERIAKLVRPEIDGLRWTGRDQWHVTLRFLGPVAGTEAVVDALTGLAPIGPATAVLGPGLGRFDQRILHVPVAGLEPVAAALVGATAHLGKPPDDRPFHGHVTLARVAKRAKVDLRPLVGGSVHATWAVGSVCLVESRLSPSGARYHIVDHFPLSNR